LGKGGGKSLCQSVYQIRLYDLKPEDFLHDRKTLHNCF
jgi:hypothetical protein